LRKITIIGAGLTGTLLAIFLGRRGYSVEIIERNSDPRSSTLKPGKSINLTLCERGIKILEKAGLYDSIAKLWVPAYGRYIHLNNNETEIQPYGNHNEALYSISRQNLNSLLLIEALKHGNVSITFNTKCMNYDIESSKITLLDENHHHKDYSFDTLIAADGVHSSIRKQMQRNIGFNFSQVYSKHINKELSIPAEQARKHNLDKKYIHIWPRNEIMIIAFPNLDDSFTCTLQLPADNHPVSFSQITNESDLLLHFNQLFPGVNDLMPNLVEEYFHNPQIPMMTVRCSPWNVSDRILLIGDAAHGIWPSYGQGANAGFEDCSELDECLSLHPDNFNAAFVEFQKNRKENVDTIADLSENHFDEIRRLVADSNFLLKKKLERQINLLFPSEYFSTYSRVAFTTMPYRQAVSMESDYNQIMNKILSIPELVTQLGSDISNKLIYQVMNQSRLGEIQ
jgi:kynurenine 3-monooxygenase